MPYLSSPSSSLRIVATLALALPLAGCGLGTAAAPTTIEDVTPKSVGGVVHGGQSPIQGARVELYTTKAGQTAYGAGATVIGTGLTDANGNFVISPSVTSTTCPSTQYAYITAAGGYQAGQSTLENTQMLEMVALGSCSSISSSTLVTLNEVTTVAAGYALSGFLTTITDPTYSDSASNAIYTAIVGAPTANATATSAITATTPAGLAHAFMNAATLAATNGFANYFTTVNSGGTTTTGAVPAVMINTIANAMQSCVDTASTTAVTSTACTSFFTDTNSMSGKTPTNTLQAIQYLARNPYTAAGVGTTGLVSLSVASGAAFQPALTTEPPDWSMAILYHNGLPAPYFVALDANDTVFVGLSTTSASTPALFGISPFGVTVPAFGAQGLSGTAQPSATRMLAPDALGNIWIADNGYGTDRFSTSTGTLLGTYESTVGSTQPVAVDTHNNVWLGHVASGTGINIEGLVYTAGTTPAWTLTYTASPGTNTGSYGVGIDANQNIWYAGYYSSGVDAIVVPNSGSAASPSYTGTTTSGVTAITPLTVTAGTKPYGVAFDASGNGWFDIYNGGTTAAPGFVQEITTSGSFPITSITTGTTVAATTLGTEGPLEPAIDGAGTMFIPDNVSNGIHLYNTTSGAVYSPVNGLRSSYETVSSVTVTTGAGCTSVPTVTFGGPGTGAALTLTLAANPGGVGTGSTTYTLVGGSGYYTAPTATVSGGGCTTEPTVTTTVATVYNPRQVAIDSTGSIWFGFTTGGATEIIGVAAPTFPLLSTGKPGLSPGLTAANPLP